MQTLAGPARHEETVRRSRFVAHAAPVASEADTLAFFERVADPRATHNCWAWRLDYRHRCNDDGEPGGSAGRPILAAIESRGLEQVMVVVTRYFGGIKLGIGGLVRAYGGCASRCLDAGSTVVHSPQSEFVVETDFALGATLHQLLEAYAAVKLEEDFVGDGLRLRIALAANRAQAFDAALADASRGRARMRPVTRQS